MKLSKEQRKDLVIKNYLSVERYKKEKPITLSERKINQYFKENIEWIEYRAVAAYERILNRPLLRRELTQIKKKISSYTRAIIIHCDNFVNQNTDLSYSPKKISSETMRIYLDGRIAHAIDSASYSLSMDKIKTGLTRKYTKNKEL